MGRRGDETDRSHRRRRVEQSNDRYRLDIDGLRSVAIVPVVLFHAGIAGLSGGFVGVDVFFVISGFLITGLLLDEHARVGRISITGFYARRIRRLLPVSSLVLLVTAVGALLISAATEREQIGRAIAAASLYVSNMWFAQQSTDYMAPDVNLSPVLHYWSLSVEEQFYVIWPLLIILVGWLTRRGGVATHGTRVRLIGGSLATLALGSFALSAWLTPRSAPWAYFGIHTRAWELAVGAGVAVLRPRLKDIPQLVAAIMGWLGLAAIAVAVFWFDRHTPFPGVAAALPVLGAAAIIAAGGRLRRAGVARLLSLPLPCYVGRLSYSWYLWHWPLLMFATEWQVRRNNTAAGPGWALTALAVGGSFLLAMLSHRYVEVPLRRLPWLVVSKRRSLMLGLVLTALTLVTAFGLFFQGRSASATFAPAPDPTSAKDKAQLAHCYTDYGGSTVDPKCLFGDPHGRVKIALIGDSHAAQWAEPFIAIANQRHWSLYIWAKSACAFQDARISIPVFGREFTECERWRVLVQAQLKSIGGFSAIFIGRNSEFQFFLLDQQGKPLPKADIGAQWQAATSRTLAFLQPLTLNVVILRETPRAAHDPVACVELHRGQPQVCALDRRVAAGTDLILFRAESRAGAGSKSAHFIDFTPLLCGPSTCPVVTPSGALMYRDRQHLDAGYVMTLRPQITSLIDPFIR